MRHSLNKGHRYENLPSSPSKSGGGIVDIESLPNFGVPVDGVTPITKLYYNDKLSIEETNKILATLPYVSTAGQDMYVVCMSTEGFGVIIITLEGMYAILAFSGSDPIPLYISQVMEEGTTAGWDPYGIFASIGNPIPVTPPGVSIDVYEGIPVGIANNQLSSVLNIIPFDQVKPFSIELDSNTFYRTPDGTLYQVSPTTGELVPLSSSSCTPFNYTIVVPDAFEQEHTLDLSEDTYNNLADDPNSTITAVTSLGNVVLHRSGKMLLPLSGNFSTENITYVHDNVGVMGDPEGIKIIINKNNFSTGGAFEYSLTITGYITKSLFVSHPLYISPSEWQASGNYYYVKKQFGPGAPFTQLKKYMKQGVVFILTPLETSEFTYLDLLSYGITVPSQRVPWSPAQIDTCSVNIYATAVPDKDITITLCATPVTCLMD